MKSSKLIHNIIALSSVQAANLLLPIITLPYVTRILGVEAWGRLAFVQIVLGYFSLVTSWGFSWSATRKVAALRNDLPQLSIVFMATWMAQWFLALLVSAILLLLIIFIPFFQKDVELYAYGIGLIISGVLFPNWFLNGLEQMKTVATIQIIVRVATVPCIFLFIRNPSDAALMIAIHASAGLLSGILTIAWIKKHIRLHWLRPSRLQIWQELKEGGAIFGSTVWISLYTTLTPTILGLIAGPIAVGHYALADKARQAAQAVLAPVSQALFPRMSHLFAHNPVQARQLLKKSGIGIAVISGLVSFGLWFESERIIYLLGGNDFIAANIVLKWLSPLPFIISISAFASLQVLFPNKKDIEFNKILVLGGLLNLVIIYPLVQLNQEIGAAQSMILVETLVCLGMWIYSIKILKKDGN